MIRNPSIGDDPTHVCNSCGSCCDDMFSTCGMCTAPQQLWTKMDSVLEAAYRLGSREAVLEVLRGPPYRVHIPGTLDSWITKR